MSSNRFKWGRGAHERPADRQGRWAEVRRRVEELAEREPEGTPLHPFVAISREAGAGGKEVARLLGELLGWRVLDRQVLDTIAEELQVDSHMLALLDETDLSWFGESVLNLVHSRLVGQNTYADRLVRLILVELSHEPAIIVGRGAHIFLPKERGLAVRLVANERDRVAIIRNRFSWEEDAARRWIRETDRARQSFVRHHFHGDPDDLLGYDLVINTSRTGLEGGARLITAALATRGLHHYTPIHA
jgi:cytidylate kinase